jgi:cytochrome o ubiquinol oxidase subunit 2
LLDPKGLIGVGEESFILLATCVVLPVIWMTIAFAWRYRPSNTRAVYAPPLVTFEQHRAPQRPEASR